MYLSPVMDNVTWASQRQLGEVSATQNIGEEKKGIERKRRGRARTPQRDETQTEPTCGAASARTPFVRREEGQLEVSPDCANTRIRIVPAPFATG